MSQICKHHAIPFTFQLVKSLAAYHDKMSSIVCHLQTTGPRSDYSSLLLTLFIYMPKIFLDISIFMKQITFLDAFFVAGEGLTLIMLDVFMFYNRVSDSSPIFTCVALA